MTLVVNTWFCALRMLPVTLKRPPSRHAVVWLARAGSGGAGVGHGNAMVSVIVVGNVFGGLRKVFSCAVKVSTIDMSVRWSVRPPKKAQ